MRCEWCSILLTPEVYSGNGLKCNNCLQWLEAVKIKPKAKVFIFMIMSLKLQKLSGAGRWRTQVYGRI